MADAVYVTLLILLALILFRRRGAPTAPRPRSRPARAGTPAEERLSFKAGLARRLDRLAFWCRLLLAVGAIAYIALLASRLKS